MPKDNGAASQHSFPSTSFMCNVSLPPKIEVHSGNLCKEWKQWRQVWDAYEEVTGLRSKTSRLRVATFITCIGKEALEIHNGLPFASEEEKSDIDKVLELWETHCIGKTNIIYERYKFNNRAQEQSESIDKYVNALRALAETCEFGALKENLIRDRIVCGVRVNAVRRKLLQESSLNLTKCVDICRAAEAASAQIKEMAPSQHPGEVDLVAKSRPFKKSKSIKEKEKPSKNQFVDECKFCGRQHERKKEKCPAYGQICLFCGKPNHKSNNFKKSAQRFKRKPKVHQLVESSDQSYSSEEEILSVTTENVVNVVENSKCKSKIFAHMEIEGALIKMQVDSGASCNVLPRKFLPKSTVVNESNVKLTTYSEANLNVCGLAKIHLRNPRNQTKYFVQFVVIDEDYIPLLGSTWAQKMGLITVKHENILHVNETVSNCQGLTMEQISASYSDVFKGLGCMEGTLHLEVDTSVVPKIMPPRRVPLALKDRLKEELARLEKSSVIVKEENPTDWVSSLVVTEKPNGKLRVCIDPQHLNKALKRSHYPLPVIEDILPELTDVKVFSKADLKDGFLQVQLDKESSILITFQTPWGRYRYLRMPFEISPAPECFQRKLDQNLEGLN